MVFEEHSMPLKSSQNLIPPSSQKAPDAQYSRHKNPLKQLRRRIYNRMFLPCMIWQERLFSHRKFKILFSIKPEWEEQIRTGFLHTEHEIAFREFSPLAIKEYDLVVPLTIEDLKYLNTVRELVAGNPIPVPSTEIIELCDDKSRFNQMLQKKGYGRFIPQTGGRLAYPYMVKKRTDSWGKSCHIIHDAKEEVACAKILADQEYFSQQLVAGTTEYATHILFVEGKILCWLNVEYTFESTSPIKGQDTEVIRSLCGCPYLALFSSILRSIDFKGLCCLNYKLSDNGQPMILENNPRFGGSLAPYFFSFIRHLKCGVAGQT